MRPLENRHNSKILLKNQGFTVIEILVALVLITLVMAVAISDPFNSSEDIYKEGDALERSIRFMADEAALRNSVVRLHFFLDKEPQEYAVEYGPSDQFILPPEPEFETKTENLEEQEKLKKETKELNLKFNKVLEFQESNTEIRESVKILGIGLANSKYLKKSGDVSIYTFASGEKDDAIIIIGNDETLLSLEIDPFNQKIRRNTTKLELGNQTDISMAQEEKAKEIFEKWSKDR